jgi:hypothetical protein
LIGELEPGWTMNLNSFWYANVDGLRKGPVSPE